MLLPERGEMCGQPVEGRPVGHTDREVVETGGCSCTVGVQGQAEFRLVSAGIVERAGALFEVAAQAEGIEPEVAEAAQAGRRATAELCATFWARATADGLLDPGTDAEALAVATDVLICADTVVHLRRTRGWTGPEHRALITQTLAALLARPRG